MPYKDRERQREYARKWVAKRRQEWISENGPCQKCGSSRRLEVDHKDRRTKVSHKVWSWSKKRRLRELRKCWVLCHKCHAKKTGDDRGRARHGTDSMYARHKCRCRPCKDAHAKYARGYRKRHPE